MANVKTFSVDWDSLASIEKKLRSLSYRQKELQRKCGGTVISKAGRFQACSDIWDTDISDLYGDMLLSDKREFYVYAHLNPLEPLDVSSSMDAFAAILGMEFKPFYIGKGTNNRDGNTSRNETHRKIIQKLCVLDHKPITLRLSDCLTESESLQRESKLIDIFGLITNGGYLCNLDEGHRRLERRMRYRLALRKLCRTAGDYDRIMKELFVPEVRSSVL